MSSRDDILTGFPPTHDGEPENLRGDILDELADHLDCAVRREMRRTDDPALARTAALQRFGNPQRLARQLWIEAMKEQLMNQRIMFGTQIAMIAALVALCVVVVTSMRQNHRMQEALIARLEAVATASPHSQPNDSAASYNWPTLRLQFLEADARAILDQSISLTGEPYTPGEKRTLSEQSDAEGRASFGPMRPGVYSLSIRRSDGQHDREITLPPGPSEPVVIKWLSVPDQTVPVTLQLDLPEEVRSAMTMARIQLTASPMAGSKTLGRWYWPSRWVVIDREGRVAEIPAHESLRLGSGGSSRPPIPANVTWQDHIGLNPAIHYGMHHVEIMVEQTSSEGQTTTNTLEYPWIMPVGSTSVTPSSAGGEVITLRFDHERLSRGMQSLHDNAQRATRSRAQQ